MIFKPILRSLLRQKCLSGPFELSTRFFSITNVQSTSIKLRDYQQEAINSVHNAISRGVRRPAVVLATGGGKTVVFSHLIPQLKPSSPDRGNKTLVLAHKEELVKQAADSISSVNPNLKVEIDMRQLKPLPDADVIVASVPTLIRQTRLEKYNIKEIKTIILDECHHATANSWLKILNYFKANSPQSEIYVIGFTATMERSDGTSLGQMFDEIVFERSLLTMVQNGELVDVRFSSVDVDVDFSKVATKQYDYEINSLSAAMNDAKVNLLVALSYIKLKNEYNFKSTLIFCVDINHCKTLCGVLQREGINAQYVTGETAKHERREIIEDFKNGAIEVLCNVQVFTEGTDMPNVDSLFLARPTKSRPLLVQMIGRGLRLHKGKTHCHVVDIAGTRGTGIQSVPTLFALPPDYTIHGKTYEELVKEKDEYDKEMERIKMEEIIEKERQRRIEEQSTYNKLVELKKRQHEMSLKFTTFDGFMALESNDVEEYKDSRAIQKVFNASTLSWIRLEYDIWGYQLDQNNFLLIRRCYETNNVYFRLTINRFTSFQQRIASKYKCGKFKVQSELAVHSNLKQVITQAEALIASLKPTHFKNFSHNSPISSKQLSFLEDKLAKKMKQYYNATPELETQLMDSLKEFSKTRASDLIFALNYSSGALWIRWELQRMLGPDKRSKSAIKKVIDYQVIRPTQNLGPIDLVASSVV